MYPKTFFESGEMKPQSGTCFVLMPFAVEFDEVFDTIREAVESEEVRFKCKRADDIRGGGHIMESVLNEIGESEIIIADLTGRNPNVFYELGITHMLKDPYKVILLIQEIESMPFDLSPFRSIVYKQSISGARQLKTELQKAINEVADLIKLPGNGKNSIYQFKVEDKEVYKFPVKLFGDDHCLYDFEITGDYIGEDGIKIMLGVTKYAAGFPPEKLPSQPFGVSANDAQKIPKIPWKLSINKLTGKNATFHLTHI